MSQLMISIQSSGNVATSSVWGDGHLLPGRWLILLLCVLAIVCPAAMAEDNMNHPFPGIAYRVETWKEPAMKLFIAEIDVANPHVHVRVAPGGPDPDGPGKWQTTLMLPTKIAAREKFDLVVNGDFFEARGIKDAEGIASRFRSQIWASVDGPAATDGQVWSTGTSNRPCLVVSKDRKVSIRMMTRPSQWDWEVLSGNTMLLKDGVAVPHKSQKRNPRTAVGLDAKASKLIFLVVDGRKPHVSVGMDYAEMAEEMIRLGCHEAINLDGGGSSMMAVRDAATNKMRILNSPSDGRERAVANVLGVSVDDQQQTGTTPNR